MNPTSSVRLFGGVGEIGGNTILVEDGDTKLLLDFGKNFPRFNMYFNYPFNIPSRSITRELIKTGVVPHITSTDGKPLKIFVDYEDGQPKESRGDAAFSGVLVTHAHSDHTGNLTILKDSISLHMGSMTSLLHRTSMETRRESSIETKLY